MNNEACCTSRAQRCAACLLACAMSLAGGARVSRAVTCPVIKHNPAAEADKAFLAGDFAKAESLYRADLSKVPANPDATSGLVHALLRQQKVQDGADTVKTALAATPNSGIFLTLRGEVEFRQGEPWTAEQTTLASYKIDPCNPRTRLLFAHVSGVNSKYATARQQIGLAHQMDPEDPEIRAAWIETLPTDQRIKEMEDYLSAPRGDDPITIAIMHADLDRLKKQAGQPVHACRLTSAGVPSAEIPFIKMKGWAGHTRGFGLELGLNSATARVDIGGGEGGLTIYRSAADRAGLKRLTDNEKPAFPGAKPTYTVSSDTIKIGSLEFKDCVVKVIDGATPFDDSEGTIGADVFSDFLVTLDYPMRKLQVGPLPARPQDTQPPTPSLQTDISRPSGISNPQDLDRFIAPDLKDYTQIYRVGRSLILPTALNGEKVKLFLLDFSVGETSVAPDVARQVSKVHEKDLGGQKVLEAGEINFNFAHFSQKLTGVLSSDTSMASRMAGMEIGGFIGGNSYHLLILHLDYRDGLVKFDYIPDRGYKFE